jgi:uncharacterized protein YdeI (YjbR/CyaY-like superfamily)
MGTRDPRVDAYIERSAEFAQPILRHIREIVHAAAPQIEETMKWSMPHFDYKGPVCNMAAFKEHCAFGFWKGTLLFKGGSPSREAMGHMGRITSIRDLPSKKELIALIREAVKLNEEGVKVTRTTSRARVAEPETPDDLAAALRRNKSAGAAFRKFSPSHRREYIEWITEAKRAETRQRRVEQAIAWIAEGKSRNWKYERK